MDTEDIETLVHATLEPIFKEIDAEHQFVALPHGWTVESVSQFLPLPDRIKQKVTLLTLESLVAYVTSYIGASTVIFANEGEATYDVAFDYHSSEDRTRGECTHVASYECPKSDPWKIWNASSGKGMSQVDFAKFIEANLIDIVKPASADMLQVVLKLQVKKNVKFSTDLQLGNGQTKLVYDEDIRGTTSVGDLTIPDVFQLGIPVFIDGIGYKLDARLRYQLGEGGKLLMWYELVRPLDVYRAAIKAVSDSLRKQLEEVLFFIGKRS